MEEQIEKPDDGVVNEPGVDMTTDTVNDGSPATTVRTDSRNWATLTHLSAFIMFLGIPSPIGPLVAWLIKSDDPEVVDAAKESLNFNISFLIYSIVAGISILLLVGIILLPAVLIAWFVLVIIAAVRTSNGEQYRYPFTIRLIS